MVLSPTELSGSTFSRVTRCYCAKEKWILRCLYSKWCKWSLVICRWALRPYVCFYEDPCILLLLLLPLGPGAPACPENVYPCFLCLYWHKNQENYTLTGTKVTSTYGGIFAQRSMDLNEVNILTKAPLDLEIEHDISHLLHYQTPGDTQRGDVSILQKIKGALIYWNMDQNFKNTYINKCRSNWMPLIITWPWMTHFTLIADDMFIWGRHVIQKYKVCNDCIRDILLFCHKQHEH